MFRSPFAVVAWWVWAAFAVANLIDLPVQGRDRQSLVTALGLLLITGVAYTVALRPRITAADDGLRVLTQGPYPRALPKGLTPGAERV